MRVVILFGALLWALTSLAVFFRARERTADGKLTACYIILWPLLLAVLILNQPAQMWLAVPVMFGFIPWVMAGPHLWEIMKDPGCTRSDEIIGIPKAYWKWGGLGAILLGICFN
jgi:hypothetical protein